MAVIALPQPARIHPLWYALMLLSAVLVFVQKKAPTSGKAMATKAQPTRVTSALHKKSKTFASLIASLWGTEEYCYSPLGPDS